ncbi:MAG: GNAT family N-acetyltransferase [bacterium]
MTDSDKLVIRPLTIFEVPAILEFRLRYDYVTPFANIVENKKDSLLYTILKMFWHRKRMLTLVAVRENQIVGYITMIFGKQKSFQGNAYLVSAAVDGVERGKGVGTRLFNEIESYALSRGTRRIEFDVFASNVDALRLYERLGYEVEGRKRRVVESQNGYDDIIFMAKFLK